MSNTVLTEWQQKARSTTTNSGDHAALSAWRARKTRIVRFRL